MASGLVSCGVRDWIDTYTEKLGYSWDADLALADVNPADYAALVIPGERAPEYIRTDSDSLRIIRSSLKSRSQWRRYATRLQHFSRQAY